MPTDKRQGGDAGTKKDNDDQRRLRNEVAEEIEAVMHKHGVGGAMFLCSEESAAWRFVLPQWSLLQFDTIGVLRFKGNTRTPRARALIENTLHYIGAVRDMAGECATMYGDLFACVERSLPDSSISHSPFKGFGVGGSGD